MGQLTTMADTSWKSHLAILRKRRLKGISGSSSSKTEVEGKAREEEEEEEVHMIGVVSPGTPTVSPQSKGFADHEKVLGDEEEEEMSLRDSYLQRRILEITSSTSWLSASVDDDEPHHDNAPRPYLKNVVSPDIVVEAGQAESGQARSAAKGYLSDDAQEKDVFSLGSSTRRNFKKDFDLGTKDTGDEELALHHGRSPPTTPTRNANDQCQPLQSESPSTHTSASATAAKKVNVTLPGEKASGRIIISPGRNKEDSEFARRLQLSESYRDNENEEKDVTANGDSIPRINERDTGASNEWKAARTSDGRTYYYNRRSRVSAWKLPKGAKLVESGQPHNRNNAPLSVQSSVSQAKTGLFCMFCGVNPSEEGGTLEAHLSMCSRLDVKDSDAIHIVYALSAKMGLSNGTSSSVVGSRHSQASQASSVKYEDSFDSFVLFEAEQGPGEKEKCHFCGRTFAMGRLAHHEPSCRDSHSFKKVPYDSGRKRTQGTPLEFHPSRSPAEPRSGSKPNTPSDRRRDHGK